MSVEKELNDNMKRLAIYSYIVAFLAITNIVVILMFFHLLALISR